MSNKNKSVSPPKNVDNKNKNPSPKIADKKKDVKANKAEYKRKLAIPEEKLEEYKESFDYFDRDGSGEITIVELKGLLHSLGQKTNEGRVREMVEELDQNGDGMITFEEYVTIMEKQENPDEDKPQDEEDTDDDIIKAFKVFDVQKKGFLNCTEFKHILKNLGDENNRFNDNEVEQVFREADLDQDGKINYYEFVEFWKAK